MHPLDIRPFCQASSPCVSLLLSPLTCARLLPPHDFHTTRTQHPTSHTRRTAFAIRQGRPAHLWSLLPCPRQATTHTHSLIFKFTPLICLHTHNAQTPNTRPNKHAAPTDYPGHPAPRPDHRQRLDQRLVFDGSRPVLRLSGGGDGLRHGSGVRGQGHPAAANTGAATVLVTHNRHADAHHYHHHHHRHDLPRPRATSAHPPGPSPGFVVQREPAPISRRCLLRECVCTPLSPLLCVLLAVWCTAMRTNLKCEIRQTNVKNKPLASQPRPS